MTKPSTIKIAHIVSGVFHPLLVPLYLSFIVLFIPNLSFLYPFKFRLLSIGIVFYTYVLVPFALLFILKKLNQIKDIQLNDRKERFIPMLLTAICYFIGIRILHSIDAPVALIIIMKGICLAAIIATIITIFWKISIHSIAMGGVLSSIVLLSLMFKQNLSDIAIIVTIIGGLVGWARLELERHDIKQICYGFLTGFCAMILSFYLHVLIK